MNGSSLLESSLSLNASCCETWSEWLLSPPPSLFWGNPFLGSREDTPLCSSCCEGQNSSPSPKAQGGQAKWGHKQAGTRFDHPAKESVMLCFS